MLRGEATGQGVNRESAPRAARALRRIGRAQRRGLKIARKHGRRRLVRPVRRRVKRCARWYRQSLLRRAVWWLPEAYLRSRLRARLEELAAFHLAPVTMFDWDAARLSARVLEWLAEYDRAPAPAVVHGTHFYAPPTPDRVPATYVVGVDRAIVVGKSSHVLVGRRRSRLILPTPDCAPELRSPSFWGHFQRRWSRYWLKANPRLRTGRRIPRGILLTNRFSHNYFHFLIEALQGLCLAERVVAASDAVLLASRLPERERELLELFGSPWPLEEIEREDSWSVEELYLPVIGAHAHETAAAVDRTCYDTRLLPLVRTRILAAARHRAARVGSPPKADLIYLSRRRHLRDLAFTAVDGRQLRALINEDEVEAYIRSLGGTVVYPERLHPADQALLFNGASVVVGPAGAAFANAMFCEPGTTCISLHSNRGVPFRYFVPIAGVADLDWHLVVGEPLRAEITASYSVDLRVLASAIEPALERIRSRGGGSRGEAEASRRWATVERLEPAT